MSRITKLIDQALGKLKISEIEGILPSTEEMRFEADGLKEQNDEEFNFQASQEDIVKREEIALVIVRPQEMKFGEELRKRPELLVGKAIDYMDTDSFIGTMLKYSFSDYGLALGSHGDYKTISKISRFLPWRDSRYRVASVTEVGSLPALMMLSHRLGYGYLSITGCKIGKSMTINNALEASKKCPGFCCIVNAGSKEVETKDFRSGIRSEVNLETYLSEVFEGINKATKEAISIFIARIIDSPETCHFLCNGKSFKKNSNYYTNDSVETHIHKSICDFLNFLYENQIIGEGMYKEDYHTLSEEAADGIVLGKLKEDENYVKKYNARLLVNKFYRKRTIEPQFFESKGYSIKEFLPFLGIEQGAISDIPALAAKDAEYQSQSADILIKKQSEKKAEKEKQDKKLFSNLRIRDFIPYVRPKSRIFSASSPNLPYVADNDNGVTNLLRILIENGLEVDQVYNNSIGPLISICAAQDKFEAVKLLLEEGANPNLPGRDGKLPLQFCRSERIAELIKSKGGRFEMSKSEVNTKSNNDEEKISEQGQKTEDEETGNVERRSFSNEVFAKRRSESQTNHFR